MWVRRLSRVFAVLLVGLWPAPLLDAMRATTLHLAQQLLVSKIAP